MVWLIAPSLIGAHQRVLAALGVGDSTKVLGTDFSCWEFIFSELSDTFKKPGTPTERTIKHKIDSVPPAKRWYRMSPMELAEVRKQLYEYLSKG